MSADPSPATQRDAEARTRTAQGRVLALFIENTPAAVAMFDLDMRYLMASRRWRTDYGLDGEEILGRSHYEVFPDIPERWKQIHRRCLTGESAAMEEDRFDRDDGSVDWVRWEIHPWRQEDGSVGGIIMFTEVVTAQKRVQEELAAKDRELAQAQKMEALGRLAGGMAHDFNNFLTAMIGFVDLARRRVEAEDPVHGLLADALRAGERATELTHSLLALSHDQGTATTVLDLNDSLRQLASMLERVIGTRAELTLELDPTRPSVRMDPSLLERLVLNLVGNARDAMPEGGRLTIRTSRAGERVQLAVLDEGEGMDDATRERMFEPFFTTKPPGRGTGLGLSTVYAIVQSSGGTIAVQTAPGRGTRVEVELPWCARDADTDVKQAPQRPVPRKARIDAHVLLVEDDEAVRRLLRLALAGAGARITEAVDGEEGLRRWQERDTRIDLLLTDVMMPGMNGNQLATCLRAEDPDLPVLLCSGYSEDAPELIAERQRGVRFLRKPIRMGDLLDTVEALLAEARGVPP